MHIPSSLKSISDAAFLRCSSLENVTLHASVTKLGWYSFKGTSIRTLKIPKSMKEIGLEAFFNCTRLQSVIVDAPAASYGSSLFVNTALKPDSVYFTKALTRAEGFPVDLADIRCLGGGQTCVCEAGYGNGVTDERFQGSYFNCAPCSNGSTSTVPLSQKICTMPTR